MKDYFEKPVVTLSFKGGRSDILCVPVKPGTRIRLKIEEYYSRTAHEQWLVGKLQYRLWPGEYESPGIQYGPDDEEWRVLLEHMEIEIIE